MKQISKKKRQARRAVVVKKPVTVSKTITRAITKDSFGEFTWLDPMIIRCDSSYQRKLRQNRVKEINLEFDAHLFEPPNIGLREDNEYYAADGWHRIQAAIARKIKLIPTMVHLDSTKERESHIFVQSQEGRIGLLPHERFNSKVIAGTGPGATADEKIATEINSRITFWGFHVPANNEGAGRKDNRIRATSSLEHLYRAGGIKVIDQTLRVMREAWDGVADSCNGMLIKGIGFFIIRYGSHEQYDFKTLVKQLSKTAPKELAARMESVAKVLGLGAQQASRQGILDVYNWRRSSKIDSNESAKYKPRNEHPAPRAQVSV